MHNRPIALLLAALLFVPPHPGVAQVVLPPLQPAAGPAAVRGADPPSVVGRIAAIDGTVSYHLAGATSWDRASINLPLTTGAAVWTEPGGQASLGVAGNRIVLAASTAFDFDRLDEQQLAATQGQGESYLHLRQLPAGASYQVTTPRGVVTLATVGRYDIVSGDVAHPTVITVLDGVARVSGLPVETAVGPNQTLTITGDGTAVPFAPTVGPAEQDEFLKRMLAAERPVARPAAAPPAVALMTGAEALDSVGEWADTPEYGAAWYPPDAGYIPYRNGRWAYVAPWGWTWVDNAPWGFAPSHYGRWAEIGGRWAWCPGRDFVADRPPAYAPALVGFIAGVAVGSVAAWAPLGPREPYRPPYPSSQRYLEALNRPTGAAFRGPVVAPVNIVNRNAITVVSNTVLVNSGNVAEAARPLPAGFSRPARPLQYRPAIAPTAATFGAPRGVLRQQGVPISAPAAPGPAFRPSPIPSFAAPRDRFGPASVPSEGRPQPLLRTPAVPGVQHNPVLEGPPIRPAITQPDVHRPGAIPQTAMQQPGRASRPVEPQFHQAERPNRPAPPHAPEPFRPMAPQFHGPAAHPGPGPIPHQAPPPRPAPHRDEPREQRH